MSARATGTETDVDLDVDVIVVGAGIAGISAAAELSATHRVVLIEQEAQPALHASGRSASVLSETSGHPVVCALAHASRRFFERPPDGFCDHPLLSPRGLVWVGESGDEPLLDALAARAERYAPTSRRLTAGQARQLLPTFTDASIAAGAVHEPDAMAVDAAALVGGWLRVLRARGGSLVTTRELVEGRRIACGWRLVARSAERTLTCTAPVVVNAAGAWVDEVARRCGVAPLPVTPMRRTAAIAPAPDDVATWPLVMDVAGRYYCEPEPGGLLVSPADETPSPPCDAHPDEIDVALALDRVREATGLPLRSIRRAWAGLRTFAPDRAPVVGEDAHAPGFWWLAGQGGAGIKTAPAMADVVAASVRGEPMPSAVAACGVTASELSPGRFTRTG